jgi:hypothetical protein
MFEAAPDLTSLRQGDVIRGMYLPRYSLSTLSLLHKMGAAGGLEYEHRAILKAEQGFAVVISQCCEFNQGKRNAFSLARLLSVRQALWPDPPRWGFSLAELVPAKWTGVAVGKLREANTVTEEGENAAVNVYLYDADGHVLTEPHIVDFTQVMSVRMEDKDKVLRGKALQLDREHRLEFQFKLSYFYSRPAD